MNPEAAEILRTIASKDLNDLTSQDKAILRARRSYLTPEQAERLKGALNEKPERVKEENIEGPTRDERRTYRQLQAQAAELGLEKVVGVTRNELEGFISTALGPVDR